MDFWFGCCCFLQGTMLPGTPLDKWSAHHRAQSDHFGVWFLAQGPWEHGRNMTPNLFRVLLHVPGSGGNWTRQKRSPDSRFLFSIAVWTINKLFYNSGTDRVDLEKEKQKKKAHWHFHSKTGDGKQTKSQYDHMRTIFHLNKQYMK